MVINDGDQWWGSMMVQWVMGINDGDQWVMGINDGDQWVIRQWAALPVGSSGRLR